MDDAERLAEIREAMGEMEAEPEWALGRVMLAARLEAKCQRLEAEVEKMRGELLIVASSTIVPELIRSEVKWVLWELEGKP